MSDSQKEVLSDLSFEDQRLLEHADEKLHSPYTDAKEWAETSWWAFASEDGKVGGWFYLLVRRNMDLATLGVYVWDDTSTAPWEFPYSKQFTHIPLSETFDLDKGDLPDIGASMQVNVPFKSYSLSFEDGGQLSMKLSFEALIDPQPVGVSANTGHLDQILWANGVVEVEGKKIDIDGPAVRDRTWSLRPESNVGQYNFYGWGADRDQGFHYMSLMDESGAPIFLAGFIWRDGEIAKLADIDRIVEKRGADGQPFLFNIVLTDDIGRTMELTGEPKSAAALVAFTGYLCWSSVVHWTLANNTVLKGEDHDTWPHSLWRKTRLTGTHLPKLS